VSLRDIENQILDVLQDRAQDLQQDELNQALFFASLEFIETRFPNPALKRIATILSYMVEQGITRAHWSSNIKTLAFVVVRHRDVIQSGIMIPENWSNYLLQDPITQLGALIFTGSQAVDYVNDMFLTEQDRVRIRAEIYEAEFLSQIRNMSPDWEPGSYQAQILQDYPRGLASPGARDIIYQIRPLIQA